MPFRPSPLIISSTFHGKLRRHFLTSPCASNCFRYAQRSSISLSSLAPLKLIVVPGIFLVGSFIYSLKDGSRDRSEKMQRDADAAAGRQRPDHADFEAEDC